MDLVRLLGTLLGAFLAGLGMLLAFVACYMLVVGWLWEKVTRPPCRAAGSLAIACYRAVTGRSKPRAGSVRRGEHGLAYQSSSPGETLAPAWRRMSWKRNGIRDVRPPRQFVFGRAEEGHLYESITPLAELAPTQPLVAVRTSFTCPRCGRVSRHPQDAKEGYCGHCHDFTGGFGGWPVHRLGHWPASLQIQELGGIIVDDLVVKPAETADTAGTDYYTRLIAWQDSIDRAIKEKDSRGAIPRLPLGELAWVLELIDKAKETSVAEHLCFEMVDGGFSIRRNRAGTHTTFLFAMPFGVWYLFWSPKGSGVADRTWSYDWAERGEMPFRKAILAAIDWDGDTNTEPVGYTERLT